VPSGNLAIDDPFKGFRSGMPQQMDNRISIHGRIAATDAFDFKI
jgi:hypothetical protein